MVQLKLQKPFSKNITGCIMPPIPYSINAGFNTFVGHLLIHKWQEEQWRNKCSVLCAPGGLIGVWRVWDFPPVKHPPFPLPFASREGVAIAIVIPANRNFLFSSLTTVIFSVSSAVFFREVYDSALNLQLSTQLKQSTQ